MNSSSSNGLIKKIANILDFHKGDKIATVDISEQSVIADFFVIAQGYSAQQVKSLADYLEADLKKCDIIHNGLDGYNEGKWIVMDYGDVIVHLFKKEEREYYDIERLWDNGSNIKFL
jgi:ribosome-associated protein